MDLPDIVAIKYRAFLSTLFWIFPFLLFIPAHASQAGRRKIIQALRRCIFGGL
jgi:hypothetical protein